MTKSPMPRPALRGEHATGKSTPVLVSVQTGLVQAHFMPAGFDEPDQDRQPSATAANRVVSRLAGPAPIALACWHLEISSADVMLSLHRNRNVCVPGDVNLVANLDLIEHRRIDDTSAIFPSVRTSEGDRRCILVDRADGRGHRSLHGCRAPQVALPALQWCCRSTY